MKNEAAATLRETPTISPMKKSFCVSFSSFSMSMASEKPENRLFGASAMMLALPFLKKEFYIFSGESRNQKLKTGN
jgi:hypothetical protein